jgi:hypothetical protein
MSEEYRRPWLLIGVVSGVAVLQLITLGLVVYLLVTS